MQFARAFLVLGLFSLAACGGDSLGDECKDACENPCEGQTVPDVDECKADCEELADALEETGCEGKVSDATDCVGGDTCDEVTQDDLQRCSDEIQSAGQCLQDYCDGNSSNAFCQENT